MTEAEIVSYEELAAEYYNPLRHPTCKNFRDASALYIASVMPKLNLSEAVVEVGAGKSVVGQVFLQLGASLATLLISDQSLRMIWHSREFCSSGARLIVANALALPVASGAVSTVVSSLGD